MCEGKLALQVLQSPALFEMLIDSIAGLSWSERKNQGS
jgi:hypothetical protein